MSVFKKKPIKPKKTRLEVGFFRRVFWVLLGGFLGGFFIANPWWGRTIREHTVYVFDR
jgi:hypothetical protein